MVSGLVIPADAGLTLREIDVTSDGAAVSQTVGGFMEAIDLPEIGVTIYVNEEGLLRHLPFNSRASFLWWYRVPAARQRAMLVGDAVVTGLPDENGADTDLPTSVRTLLLSTSRFRVEVRLEGEVVWHTDQTTYPDYWEAIVWAMVLLERVMEIEDVRVVPIESVAEPPQVA